MKVLSYLEFSQEVGETKLNHINFMIKKGFIEPAHFYSQPFKPELTTELFEGWELTEYKEHEVLVLYTNKYSRISFSYFYDNGGYEIYPDKQDQHTSWLYPYPRTLDDFINDCKKARIKLRWIS